LLLGGRCARCRGRISLRYPLVELATGLISVNLWRVAAQQPGAWIIFLYYFSLVAALEVLALLDFETQYIDERIIIAAVIAWAFLQLALVYFGAAMPPALGGFLNGVLSWPPGPLGQLALAVLAAMPFLFLFTITLGRGMGLGDAKVAALMGLYLVPGDLVLSLLTTIALGGCVGLALLAVRRRFGQAIPYVPFLFLGTVATLFWGETITRTALILIR